MYDNKRPLISVIVPVYGVEPYLDQCVESIVKQTYGNLEIILVDDGGRDRCPVMIDQWQKKDSRIITVHKENGGVSSARNAGIRVSSGEFIAFVDSDDWLEPECMEILYQAISMYEAQIAVGGFTSVQGNRKRYSEFFMDSELKYYACTANQAFRYFLEISIAVWGKLYRKAVIENISFVEGRLAEEFPYQVEALKKSDMVTFCNRHLYNYRVRDDSLAHTITPGYLIDYVTSLSEVYDMCSGKLKSGSDYCRGWLSSLLYEFMAAEKFGEKEKRKYAEILFHALKQAGGEEKLLENINYPETIIYYTFMQFGEYMDGKEKRKLQQDYRKVFSFELIKKGKKQFYFKYFPAYFSLPLTGMLIKMVKRK